MDETIETVVGGAPEVVNVSDDGTAGVTPECGTPGDVWVDSPKSEWDTSETPVGLNDIDPLVVEETKNMMATPEKDAREDEANREKERAAFSVPRGGTKIPRHKKPDETPEEIEKRECTFKPDLSISSNKRRTKVSSHQYGVAPVTVKPPPQADVPSFQPELKVGKTTEKKRQAATGSNYGKSAVVVKPKVAPTPEFKPQLVDAAKSKAMREKAAPRYLESQKKFVKIGKDSLQQTEQKRQLNNELPKFSLYADRPATAPEAKSDKPSFVIDASLPAEDPMNKRAVNPVPPVVPTKFGADLKAKQTSRYATTSYTPPKGARPASANKKSSSRSWAPAAAPGETVGAPMEKLQKPQTKTKKVVQSAYAADVYKPQKVAPKKKEAFVSSEFNTSLTEGSPITLPPPPAPKSSQKKKFATVSSSGYGVVMPEPSVPAKIHALNHRSIQSQLRSSDFRASQASIESDRTSIHSNSSNAENEAPEFGTLGRNHINDLISKASILDPQHTPPCAAVPPPPATASESPDEDGEPYEESAESEEMPVPAQDQLTVL